MIIKIKYTNEKREPEDEIRERAYNIESYKNQWYYKNTQQTDRVKTRCIIITTESEDYWRKEVSELKIKRKKITIKTHE